MPEQAAVFRRVLVSQQEFKLSFDWSFKPLSIFMRCGGVPLNFELSKGWSWWMVTSLGFLLFLLNAECHFGMIGREIYRKRDPFLMATRSQYSSAFTWNHYIEIINNIGAVVGCHALLMASSLTNWGYLVQALRSTEKLNFYKEKDFRGFRNNCYVGAVLCIVVSRPIIYPNVKTMTGNNRTDSTLVDFLNMQELIFWVFLLILTKPDDKQPIVYQVMYVGIYLFPIYTFASLFLFGSLCWIAYTMLKILGSRIESYENEGDTKQQQHDRNDRKPNKYWKHQLTTLKVQYYWLGEFVYHINNCFGPLFLLLMTSYFVRMINSSFTFLMFLRGTQHGSTHSNVLHLFLLVKDFITFCVITYVPYLMQNEVHCIVINSL